MGYDIDHDYPFETAGDGGLPYLPDGMTMDGNLYVLPNGKYLPSGSYRTVDGGWVIYDPPQLSPYAEMIAQFNENS